MAHVELAKAEAQAIQGEVARVAVFAGVAFTVILLAVILAFVGASLFIGEWLLGSIGWGVLHGVLLLIAIAMVCVLSAVGMSGRRIGGAFVFGVLVALIVGVILGLALPNQAYARIGDAALPGVEPGVRPLVVGVAIWALLGLIGGLIASLGAKGADGRILTIVGGVLLGVVIGAITRRDDRAAGRRRHRHRRRLPHLDRPDGPRHRPDGRRHRSGQGQVHPDPDDRDRQGDARVATEQDAARDRVLAARADLEGELQRLEASGRAAIDIPAKIRRRPARAVAVVGTLGFLALRGPQRLFGAARRAVGGDRAPVPERMLPEEVEKTLRKFGDDGDKVAAALERDFADYAAKAHKERVNFKRLLLLTVARPLLGRAAKATGDFLFTPDGEGFSTWLAKIRERGLERAREGAESAEGAAAEAQDRIAAARDEESGDAPDSPADETAPTGI